ncbi:hypothetical protein L6164_006480 [Bauhinia variegata]|uniref:Uncharacterized protein n=1 Tax=Bauhinia variegata TaxID=167791 RepID=A0ACB9PUF5_BAUVA|nr:hypothetical protein L6164_006480 [Bauhinia variegata]
MEKKEEDRRREAAIASTPCLQPNFNTKGVTKEQLAKVRELHKRRLQVKSKSKAKTKHETNKSQHNNLKVEDSGAENKSVDHKDLSLSNQEGFDSRNKSCLVLDDSSVHLASNKRQKLYWGLDTKERWERKSNM